MERAQDLLADSALTIAQVAERLGYPQQAAFAQAFKQHTGTTPTAWRSQHIKNEGANGTLIHQIQFSPT